MNKELISDIVETILNGYDAYINDFKQITRRIPENFKNRDWQQLHANHRERLRLYKDQLKDIITTCKAMLKEQADSKEVWAKVRESYFQAIAENEDRELAGTFFNSVFRKVFPGKVIDEALMFYDLSGSNAMDSIDESLFRNYPAQVGLHEAFTKILEDFDFGVPYYQKENDINYLVESVKQVILSRYKATRETTTQVLRDVFYRNKAAYLIGRTYLGNKWMPFIIPFLHNEKGIFADTLIFDPNIMSGIFSYTRSYFMAPIAIPSQTVNFLQSVIQHKRPYELYNAIGFNKHGKTAFYKDFTNHLKQSEDNFILAEGIKGMVMTVFTLPSSNIVFKLIKDHFEPPKNMTRQQVKEKYKLVGLHDRVGRMADTHEFENFRFPLNRIDPLLMKELKTNVNSLLSIEGDTLVIKHLYIERRLRPLNLYLETCSLEEAKHAVDEYAKAILQMAQANIFPGDMMTKNFGVTRQNRVIFYDYDEIEFLHTMNFRAKPKPQTYDQIYASRPWYEVKENDVFPEDFKRFMIGRQDVKAYFIENNPELFDPEYWSGIQSKLRKGELIHAFPYTESMRFRPEETV
ncbi:bifunctional isocitrate dehydrogenase kinase/phosphatase [Cyclobacterium sp. 1_MG-2023]|uniref:bifunctional isocitrate dehydrogenase kinase/phosphatase n=1 Tax=Cyclobacterium sp. 1_MG-2023 TaxID=3062681 RepID=UPI0026E34F82|nr:bifunctional isocitrate dehydrogenase kinase/phosphatase [Cyclobacterium sp. 1_MG-2023]MDO6438470.1 bifunctional isocitrate dehydrogenase kinase/phosphatase [Cyclobacterium sp. 1_MG-2023]